MPAALVTALLALQLTAPAPVDLDRGLAARLPFDGDALESVSRVRLNAPGTRPVDGLLGGALRFDGQRGLVSLGARFQPDRFTVAAWVRPEAVDRTQVVVSKIRNLPGHTQRNFELRLEPGGRAVLMVPSGRGWESIQSRHAVAAGRWTHLAAVYDGRRASLYLDGAREPESMDVRYASTRTDTVIGARGESGGRDGRSAGLPGSFFLGALDEVRLYRRPLADEEVAALAARPAPPPVVSTWDDDAGDLARLGRLAVRFDLATIRRDAALLRQVEAKVLEEVAAELEQARRDRRRGIERRLGALQRARQVFTDGRGQTDTMSLDQKRSALAELSESAWLELVEMLDDRDDDGWRAPRDDRRDRERERTWEREWESDHDRDADRRDDRRDDRTERDEREAWRPPAGPPPPPPAPRVQPLRAERFDALYLAMRQEGFGEGRLRVLDTALAASDAWLSVDQVSRLLGLFSFSQEQLALVRRVRPRLVDPDQAFALYDKFTFSADKEELRRILQP